MLGLSGPGPGWEREQRRALDRINGDFAKAVGVLPGHMTRIASR
ncbi:hypothetical protein F4561_004293 [Lipingzhangella halophila]|uniref:Uncharacterized protein n=1 Tax=Lipingzhangella halophila TaxID=1783352 RepID=A0A7W7RKY8_9ACTN|nr:hypothetical protein [Lipingzhangella halophila]